MSVLSGYIPELMMGLSSLLAHKLRSLLTMLGMIFGVGAVVAMLTFASGAMAATHIGTPAEQPPEDFAGRQFVDSAGCVFIRATVDGAELIAHVKSRLAGYKAPKKVVEVASIGLAQLPGTDTRKIYELDSQAATAPAAPAESASSPWSVRGSQPMVEGVVTDEPASAAS